MTLKNPIFSVKLYFLHEFGEKSTKRQNKPKKKNHAKIILLRKYKCSTYIISMLPYLSISYEQINETNCFYSFQHFFIHNWKILWYKTNLNVYLVIIKGTKKNKKPRFNLQNDTCQRFFPLRKKTKGMCSAI